MRALVTGAAGFIGTRLCERLVREGASVRALVHLRAYAGEPSPLIEVRAGDLGEGGGMRDLVNGVDVVFHLGAATQGSWPERYAATVKGTQRVLEAAACAQAKVVYVSSLGVYGLRSGLTVTEDTALDPRPELRADYARSKIAAEEIVLGSLSAGQTPVTILRPGIVFGPGRPLVGGVGRRLGSNLFAILGDGRQITPVVHIDDLVSALLTASTSAVAVGRVFNIVDPCSPTQLDYLRRFDLLTRSERRPLRIPVGPLRSLARFCLRLPERSMPHVAALAYRFERATAPVRYSSERATSELNWSPALPFEEGLEQALAAA